jgi:sugar (pentulose or hexulose) kinase
MKEKITAIFDIGKTNKKLLLFNSDLEIISEIEEKFPVIEDDDGFECDDLDLIEKWIKKSIAGLISSNKYDLKLVNFTTYGATIIYLDDNGQRVTPAYNYLKPIDERIPEKIYKVYGGRDEFCRRTASPSLGMLNSGIQPLWLKTTKPEIFGNIKHILHFPQYLSYILTGKIYSEHTSVGCHTALWDFDNMTYHPWVNDHLLKLPFPVSVETMNEVTINDKQILIGIGIHDSSASLAPYFSGSKGKFLLLSTGTWCINMNPYNNERLTANQLDRDCLCYLSVARKPVKSSRLFLGNLHDIAVEKIINHFGKPDDYYKTVKANKQISDSLKNVNKEKKVFFEDEPFHHELRDKIDMYQFVSFEEAYHQLMNELCDLTIEAINLVIPENDDTEYIYITGGFSKNQIFNYFIAKAYPSKQVFASEIANATALGAALVVSGSKPSLNLGLRKCEI